MTNSSSHPIAEKLGRFMIQNAACIQAAKHLGHGVEISVLVDDQIPAAFFRSSTGAGFELRQANKPDVEFVLTSSAVESLTSNHEINMGELGVEVLKLYISKQVKIRVKGNIFGILKNGYLGIVKDAGLPFAKFLAENGVSNISKIPDLIKKMKSS